MKIAFCVSGQPRTWRKNYKNWFELFPNQNIDVFFHTFTHNSLSVITQNHNDTMVDQTELDELVDILRPKKYQIENKKEFKFESTPTFKPVVAWSAHQFYGIMRSAELKRQYEIENNFEYDVVVKLRFDLLITEGFNSITKLTHNTLYTMHNGFEPKYNQHRIGDMIFYSDSLTFDKFTSFFRYIPVINEHWFNRQESDSICPEFALYYFMKMLGIENKLSMLDAKVRRTQEHLNIVKQLGDHEIL